MTTSTLRRSAFALRQHILIIIFTFAIVILVAVVTYSPWGRARSFDTYWAVGVPYLQFTGLVIVIFTSWTRMGWLWRSFAISLLLFLGVLAVGSLWERWPQLPWNQSKAARVAESFMLALNASEYDQAAAMFSPLTQHDRDRFVEDLRIPEVRPLTWQMALVRDGHGLPSQTSVEGSATFADGVELPVEVGLTWYVDRWQVYLVAFGLPSSVNPERESTLRVYFSDCCDSYGPVLDALYQLDDWLFPGRRWRN